MPQRGMMWVENHGEQLRRRIPRDQHGAPTEPEIHSFVAILNPGDKSPGYQYWTPPEPGLHNFLACWNPGDKSPGYQYLAPTEPKTNFLWPSVIKGMNPLATNIWLLRSLRAGLLILDLYFNYSKPCRESAKIF